MPTGEVTKHFPVFRQPFPKNHQLVLVTNEHFCSDVYAYKGSLTNSTIAKKFNMRYKELGLGVAVRDAGCRPTE